MCVTATHNYMKNLLWSYIIMMHINFSQRQHCERPIAKPTHVLLPRLSLTLNVHNAGSSLSF